MASPLFSLLFLLLPLTISTASPLLTTTATPNLTAYDALESFNFPPGLLPEGAVGYDLDPSTGRFSAYLSGDCSFSLEGSYQLKYKSTISGYISRNRITSLTGVTVKVLFFWVNIIEIVRDDDALQFSVGILSADFPIENFYVCPRCGCGVDCDGVGETIATA